MSIDSLKTNTAEDLRLDSLRPTIVATRHVASAGHYLAAHAAFSILEAGGNAVDAGVAAGLTMGVVQSDLVNVAGVAPIILWDSGTGSVHTISGLGRWPKRATAAFFRERFGGQIPLGVLRSVVPAAPDAWITALVRFGTMSFGEVAEAAFRFADEGFVMYPLMAELIRAFEAEYRLWPTSAEIYLPGGRPPVPGELFRQQDLAPPLLCRRMVGYD
jgi:gamma-glutamyltranspeptidase/glutathione hydrolase